MGTKEDTDSGPSGVLRDVEPVNMVNVEERQEV